MSAKENTLRWSATFTIVKQEAKEFMEWMERDHIPKIHKTGFFEPDYRKIFEEKQNDDVLVVQYIHTPRSEKDWDDFHNGSRPQLREEFLEEWGGLIESGDLKAVMLQGRIEILTTE